jgi:hypothetical protein
MNMNPRFAANILLIGFALTVVFHLLVIAGVVPIDIA